MMTCSQPAFAGYLPLVSCLVAVTSVMLPALVGLLPEICWGLSRVQTCWSQDCARNTAIHA